MARGKFKIPKIGEIVHVNIGYKIKGREDFPAIVEWAYEDGALNATVFASFSAGEMKITAAEHGFGIQDWHHAAECKDNL